MSREAFFSTLLWPARQPQPGPWAWACAWDGIQDEPLSGSSIPPMCRLTSVSS